MRPAGRGGGQGCWPCGDSGRGLCGASALRPRVRPSARCPRGGFSASLRHSSPRRRREARRGPDPGPLVSVRLDGCRPLSWGSRAHPQRSFPTLEFGGLRLPGWTGLGVWSVLQEVGTPSEDLRRPETAGGPRGSERGGVASPVLRVNEKHPTPRVPGCPPRRPHHGDTVSACSACTASRCLRGDTGTLGFRRVPLTKHMMGGGLTQMDIREDSHM